MRCKLNRPQTPVHVYFRLFDDDKWSLLYKYVDDPGEPMGSYHLGWVFARQEPQPTFPVGREPQGFSVVPRGPRVATHLHHCGVILALVVLFVSCVSPKPANRSCRLTPRHESVATPAKACGW